MKITIYELLGLIKDGKAPKKIMLDGFIFELVNNDVYVHDEMGLLDEYISITRQLNTKVEILDEKTYSYTFKKDEKGCFTDKDGNRFSIIPVDEEDEFIDIDELDVEYDNDGRLSRLLNDLIKNQKLIINKLKEEGK